MFLKPPAFSLSVLHSVSHLVWPWFGSICSVLYSIWSVLYSCESWHNEMIFGCGCTNPWFVVFMDCRNFLVNGAPCLIGNSPVNFTNPKLVRLCYMIWKVRKLAMTGAIPRNLNAAANQNCTQRFDLSPIRVSIWKILYYSRVVWFMVDFRWVTGCNRPPMKSAEKFKHPYYLNLCLWNYRGFAASSSRPMPG